MPTYSPSYLRLERHQLKSRTRAAYALLESCVLCPRRCGVARLRGEIGLCRSGIKPVVASRNRHYGEEPPLSGNQGSGTIFFTNCNLRCKFCQNYPISQLGVGREITSLELSRMMLWLQKQACHNVNLVTPSHWVPQILEALGLAVERGFHLPLVYNSNGYDSVETLKLLEGIVDIYLPDIKYYSEEVAEKLSCGPGYCTANRSAVKEMLRQVPDYQLNKEGILQRGVIVRHLILPANKAGSEQIFRFIAKHLSPETTVSIMTQYFPAHQVVGDGVLGRRITRQEYLIIKKAWKDAGLKQGWYQVPEFLYQKTSSSAEEDNDKKQGWLDS